MAENRRVDAVKILVLGAKGQLGQALSSIEPPGLEVTYADIEECNLTDATAVDSYINAIDPAYIINCAAYTDVDKAEENMSQCFAINSDAVRNIASCSQDRRLIHVSTDFVFDGKKTTPYRPEDTPAPLSVYGKSKLSGERAALDMAPEQVMIIRTAWLYNSVGANFVNTMLRLMAEKETLSVVNDQRGAPTFAVSLANVIWRVIVQKRFTPGFYHWSDAGDITWYDFALAIQQEAIGKDLLSRPIPIKPIPSVDYPTPACRPSYSVLDSSKLELLVNLEATPWRDNLNAVINTISVN